MESTEQAHCSLLMCKGIQWWKLKVSIAKVGDETVDEWDGWRAGGNEKKQTRVAASGQADRARSGIRRQPRAQTLLEPCVKNMHVIDIPQSRRSSDRRLEKRCVDSEPRCLKDVWSSEVFIHQYLGTLGTYLSSDSIMTGSRV